MKITIKLRNKYNAKLSEYISERIKTFKSCIDTCSMILDDLQGFSEDKAEWIQLKSESLFNLRFYAKALQDLEEGCAFETLAGEMNLKYSDFQECFVLTNN